MTEFDPNFWTALKLIGSVLLLWIVITIGAALIGGVAGEMAWNEAVIQSFTSQYPPWFEYLAALVGAVLVVAAGKRLEKKICRRVGAGANHFVASTVSNHVGKFI